ncbi:MAG: type II secretion system protein GspD [Gammaproteobacteria bacterium]|uniref:Type II secretion system protein GspD n=1 Tax=OM182 bacterium TaxID=2510334 RepID=A0A520S3Y4_9GAMM|nr:type II secretion system protein GspD [Gammaproteobacteria bacterium]OUV67965.1 MAG: type II secretion system protein GspD [Gammaproteobacteria bacterium TMED133]RZO77185.1 MAG: type II secretion system protein GspD [OM182 bacterium]
MRLGDSMRTFLLFSLLLGTNISLAEQNEWKINLRNTDLREFIAQVSEISGRSFVVDPRIKGNVTVISSTPMDTEGVYELFLSVLRVHGFAAVPAGSTTKIVQQVLAKQSGNPFDFEKANTEELITRVVPVTNAPAQELVKILRPLIPQHGHVAGLEVPNVLLISDYASNINRLEKIVRRIDVSDQKFIEIIDLREAWVEDMIILLEQLAPDEIGKGAKGPNKVTIVASERTNSLVVKGEKDTVQRVSNLVRSLDVPANRTGTVQVLRLAHSDAGKMAELLSNLISDETEEGGANSQKVRTNIQADLSLNALVIRAKPSAMIELKSIINDLDVRRLQVLIEAAIVEVTTDFEHQLGSELFIGDKSNTNLPLGLTAPNGSLANILQSIATQTPALTDLGKAPLIGGGRLSETSTSFALIIRALATNRNANLLSTPSITTMDNEKAKIVVGQNVPFRTGSSLTGNQNNPFTTIQREDVGLTLEVTPHIHEGELIRLEIHQEVSEVEESSLQAIGEEAAADIITSKRTINTTVLVDDGEVIILGGLTRDKLSKNRSGVPILGKLPGLGKLFSSETDSYEKQNLLVFLRPTVLSTKSDIASITEQKYSKLYEIEIQGKGSGSEISELFNGNAW